MKLVFALWGPDSEALLGKAFRAALANAGASRVQVNLDDDEIPESVLRLQAFPEAVTAVLAVWTEPQTDSDAVVEALDGLARRVEGWEVEERVPLEPPAVADGRRADALAQVAFLRRPADLPHPAWRAHWLGPHTQIAMETQAPFGYVQNLVLRPVTPDASPVAESVEELFPSAAMRDIHAFYGSGGDDEELSRRMTRLLESVATMGADRDIDVVPTSRYVFDLRA